jgi:cell wall-associated NlpC family hydrolase
MRGTLRSMKPLLGTVTLAALLLCAGASHAQEATTAPSDSLGTLLVERGLLPLGAAVQSASNYAATMRDRASDAVFSAMSYLGVPYRRGGNTADEGFDCSGFTRHIYQLAFGLTLPRRADEQATMRAASQIDKSELQPGDLVFFNTLKRTFSHVGIYVGDGKFIHAPRTGAVVRVDSMNNSYWAPRFDGARRVSAPSAHAVADTPR